MSQKKNEGSQRGRHIRTLQPAVSRRLSVMVARPGLILMAFPTPKAAGSLLMLPLSTTKVEVSSERRGGTSGEAAS